MTKESFLEMIKKMQKQEKKDKSKASIQTSFQYNCFPNIDLHLLHWKHNNNILAH